MTTITLYPTADFSATLTPNTGANWAAWAWMLFWSIVIGGGLKMSVEFRNGGYF